MSSKFTAINNVLGFPAGPEVKHLSASAEASGQRLVREGPSCRCRSLGSTPGPGRSLMQVQKPRVNARSGKTPHAGAEALGQRLVREDPSCRRTTKPVHQLLSLCSRVWELQLLKPMSLEPVPHNKRSHCNEKPTHN